MAIKTLKNHPITASLMRIQELLDDDSLQSPEVASDESALFNREKLQGITKSLRSLVNQSSATLVSETALSQMNKNLQAIISELTSFISNKNVGHLTNAVVHIDQHVMSYMWAFIPKANPLSKVEAGELIDSLQERTRQTIEQLIHQKDNLELSLAQLTEALKLQDGRLTELNEVQAQSRAEMAAELSSLTTAFNKEQLLRDSEFAALLNKSKESFSEVQNAHNSDAEKAIDALNKYKADAARIVEVVGDIGVTGNYQNIANKESDAADKWRVITISLFACGIIMAVATFYKFYHEPVTPTNTLAIAVRLLYALAIAAPAFYTARESARHRTNADRARQTELELASLGPFIELMKDEDKEEIRKSLISTYFGRPVDAHVIKTVFDANGKP